MSNRVLEHIEKVTREREITVDDIKKEYCKPVTVDSMNKMNYCVGGALFLYFGDDKNFPGNAELSRKLREINPKLYEGASAAFADKIIRSNDSRNFENAWTQLRLALNYGKEK